MSGGLQRTPKASSARWWVIGFVIVAALLAGALAFDDAELTDYQIRFAQLSVRVAGGIALALGGVRYLVDRQRGLAWDKTRFIVDLFEDFDRDDDCRRARTLVDYSFFTGDHSYLRRILASGGALSNAEWEDRAAIDRYLDFFDRLYTHVFITRTLSVDDVSSFSGYVTDIYKSPGVVAFALEWGYEDVLLFAEAFDMTTEQRDREVEELRSRLA